MKKLVTILLFSVCVIFCSTSQAQWIDATPTLNVNEEIRSFLSLPQANYLLTNQQVLRKKTGSQNWEQVIAEDIVGIKADGNGIVAWSNNALYYGTNLQHSSILPGSNTGDIKDVLPNNGLYKILSVYSHENGVTRIINVYQGTADLTFTSSAAYYFMSSSSVKWAAEDKYLLNCSNPVAGMGWTRVYQISDDGNHAQVLEVNGYPRTPIFNGSDIWAIKQISSWQPAPNEQICLLNINVATSMTQEYEWYYHHDGFVVGNSHPVYIEPVTRGVKYLPSAFIKTHSDRFMCVGLYDSSLATSILSYNLTANAFTVLQPPSNQDLSGICASANGYYVFSTDHLWHNATLSSTGSNGQIIKGYELKQNYPNPFNPTTKIQYSLPQNKFVSLKVYDINGREVRRLVAEQQAAGTHEIEFNASGLASGTYFYRFETDGFAETKKLLLVK